MKNRRKNKVAKKKQRDTPDANPDMQTGDGMNLLNAEGRDIKGDV